MISLGGGPDAFVALLEDQLERRQRGDPPELDGDPLWTLEVEGDDPLLERVRESLFTIADGRLGTSGGVVFHPEGEPLVLASGLYDVDGAQTTLLPCPLWHRLWTRDGSPTTRRRRLDLRAGVLEDELLSSNGGLRATIFSSLARPGAGALRAHGDPAFLRRGSALVPAGARELELGPERGSIWIRSRASGGGSVVAAARELRNTVSLDRFAAYRADPVDGVDEADALEVVYELAAAGFEQLLAEHRSTWSSRWEAADVRVEGDPELQLAVRFALFHLMASAPDAGEAAVGARGLTGPAYRGHVFWDSDVFVLPFLAATHPPAARAMLEYRSAASPTRAPPRTPSDAKVRASPGSRQGTASTSRRKHARDQAGRLVAIRTGELEEHIVADVAWAACVLRGLERRRRVPRGAGRDLLVETARYWASRIRRTGRARTHLRRDRPRRVPRARRRQRVHERDGPMEPAPGGRASRHRAARARRVAGARRPRSSTATTRERASTSSSPASTDSSRS